MVMCYVGFVGVVIYDTPCMDSSTLCPQVEHQMKPECILEINLNWVYALALSSISMPHQSLCIQFYNGGRECETDLP